MNTPQTLVQGETVLYEVRDHVAVVTLNRPRSMNAINADLATELGHALRRLASDDEVRVGVVTGSGRAFCAGMDLKAFANGDSVEPEGHPEWGFGGFARNFIDKPLIAALNGVALGGGAELALACDLIVADAETMIGLPEVSRGLFASAGGLLRLGQFIPQKVAMQMVLTGKPISVVEAERWGLVNQIAPQGTVMAVALQMAHQITANAPLAVQASKRLIHRTAQESSWSKAPWEWNAAEEAAVFSSDDAKEGALAFAAKRSPVWRGR